MKNTALSKYVDNYEYAYLGLDPSDLETLDNPFLHRRVEDIERPDIHLVRMMRNPKYFGFTVEHLLGIKLLPIQVAILQELWVRPFPMLIASRGFGKSFLLAVFATLKCILVPDSKVVVVGAGLRQSKVIFEYMETIWHGSSILRSIYTAQKDGPARDVDRCIVRFGTSWAVFLPIGDGSKIRGLRAHTIIADEFASINPQIYETVIGGFAAVSKDPFQNVVDAAARRKMKDDGIWTPEQEMDYQSTRRGNQSIITGTADYAFKHFAQYHKRYCDIINSEGNEDTLKELFGDDVDESFKAWKSYSVIRIPYEMIPEGFMDDKIVARAKATMHMGIYQMEYGAVFTEDSDGFFKRTLIESCVTSDIRPIVFPSGPVWYDPQTKGKPDCQYVYGIDPAAERDNFSIIILELHSDHTRIVYGWSTNKKNFKERQEAGLTGEHDYYSFCCRKIRELMKVFPCTRIALDSQGGGVAILEGLHDPDKMYPGEQMLWPVINPDKEEDTDHKQGLHIIEMIQFANADWTSKANHGMRKDFEDKVLLFPRFDNITIGLAIESDALVARSEGRHVIYDSLEDCVWEIEELKNELSTIIMTKTPTSNRDRWDTPEIKEPNGKKGRLRKDRYSALLMASMAARTIQRMDAQPQWNAIGGAVHNLPISDGLRGGPLYQPNAWWNPDQSIGQGIYR